MARSISELRAGLQAFPDSNRVKNVCKPGQGATTCRYLSVELGDGSRYACEKAGQLRGAIDERIKEGTMGAQGDNCGGILEYIAQNQEVLVGNRTLYEERIPTIEEEGTFKVLKIENGTVSLDELGMTEDFALVTIRPDSIHLTVRGVGAFAGSQTVFFEKPQPAPAR